MGAQIDILSILPSTTTVDQSFSITFAFEIGEQFTPAGLGYIFWLFYPSELQIPSILPSNCANFVTGFNPSTSKTCTLNSTGDYFDFRYTNTNGSTTVFITGLYFSNPLGAIQTSPFSISGYDQNLNLIFQNTNFTTFTSTTSNITVNSYTRSTT